jgi:hypothetical protein
MALLGDAAPGFAVADPLCANQRLNQLSICGEKG